MKHRLVRLSMVVGAVFAGMFLLQAIFIPYVQKLDGKPPVPELPTEPRALGDYYFSGNNGQESVYDLKQARHYYELALTEGLDKDPTLWYQLGRIDFLEGSFTDALYKFEQQLKYFPTGTYRVYYMIGLTHGYQAKETKRAADWLAAEAGFIKFLEFDPSSPWARTDLAWIYFAQGKFAKMKPLLELGLVLQPNHPWLLNMYGLYLVNTGHPAEALTYYDRALANAEALTETEWGSAYPGNNPLFWGDGLTEFRDVINYNRSLVTD